MIYFFHHYELPSILHQARIQHLIHTGHRGGSQSPNRANTPRGATPDTPPSGSSGATTPADSNAATPEAEAAPNLGTASVNSEADNLPAANSTSGQMGAQVPNGNVVDSDIASAAASSDSDLFSNSNSNNINAESSPIAYEQVASASNTNSNNFEEQLPTDALRSVSSDISQQNRSMDFSTFENNGIRQRNSVVDQNGTVGQSNAVDQYANSDSIEEENRDIRTSQR